MKRQRDHTHDVIAKSMVYESWTTEYTSRIRLDIRNNVNTTPPTPPTTRTKKTQYKCRSTTYLTNLSKECEYNKKILPLAASRSTETKEGKARG